MRPIGHDIMLDGQRFCIGLPTGGLSPTDTTNLWNTALSKVGDSNEIWHWKNRFFWCQDNNGSHNGARVVRGMFNARYWSEHQATKAFNYQIGFRPVLWPLDEKLNFDSLFLAGIPNGTQVKAFSLLLGTDPIVVEETAYDPHKFLSFSDEFYGDEYLIPWVICDGVAICARSMLPGIDWFGLETFGFVPYF